MGLPVSRDLTINDGDVIPAWLLNKLQDEIIGWKHPELERGFQAKKFTGTNSTNTLGSRLNFTGSAVVECGLNDIPAGDRITTVTWGYIVGASGSVAYVLKWSTLDGASTGTVTPASGATSDSTGTTAEIAVVTYNHQVVSGRVYWLEFSCSTSSSALFGATVKHDNL